jgi:hypothetical protein
VPPERTGSREHLVLLFADTGIEDSDLHRFLAAAGEQLGVRPTVVADGRTPFQVFADTRFLGNSRLAPCSVHLKQRPCRRWLAEHADPAHSVLYVGIDPSEIRRAPAIERGWAPWQVRFPLCDPPHLSKQDMLAWARTLGVRPPRLYELGFGVSAEKHGDVGLRVQPPGGGVGHVVAGGGGQGGQPARLLLAWV